MKELKRKKPKEPYLEPYEGISEDLRKQAKETQSIGLQSFKFQDKVITLSKAKHLIRYFEQIDM